MTAPSPLSMAPRQPAHTAVTPESLLALDDRQFAAQVAHDAHRSQTPDMLEALRDPQVVERWATELRRVRARLQRNLAVPGRLEGTPAHRARTYLGNVRKRLAEAEALIAGSGGAR